jgi:release factor glutamine methyltransferase
MRFAVLQERANQADIELLDRILSAIGIPPEQVYSPREDSFLLLESISKVPLAGKAVLDVGTGSGVIGLYCASCGALVTVTDVDETALMSTRKAAKSLGLSLKTIRSDLFSNVSGKFDLILFNPPYLPSDESQDRTVDGGHMGRDLADRFLASLPRHLKKDGAAHLILSSLNNPEELLAKYSEFRFAITKRKALFFEELQALRVWLGDDLSG